MSTFEGVDAYESRLDRRAMRRVGKPGKGHIGKINRDGPPSNGGGLASPLAQWTAGSSPGFQPGEE
jgi:hypothetical protein